MGDFHSLPVDSSITGSGVEIAHSSGMGHEDGMSFSSVPLDVDFANETAFPAVAPRQATPSPKKCSVACPEQNSDSAVVLPTDELTPEKLSQLTETATPSEEGLRDVSECKDEPAEDWVILSSDDAKPTTASLSSMKSFDAQHPRNIFGKASTSKPAAPKVEPAAAAAGIDWSQAGMPIELIRRLVRGSANPAHHGLHCETKSNQLPMEVLRAQNLGSAKRQSSTPKTPRSQSKPRASRASSSRR